MINCKFYLNFLTEARHEKIPSIIDELPFTPRINDRIKLKKNDFNEYINKLKSIPEDELNCKVELLYLQKAQNQNYIFRVEATFYCLDRKQMIVQLSNVQ